MMSTGQCSIYSDRNVGIVSSTIFTPQNLDVAYLERARGGPRVLHVPDQHGEDDASGRMH